MITYFSYGSGMYRKHPNHTYGRNRNNSANNQAIVLKKMAHFFSFLRLFIKRKNNGTSHIESWVNFSLVRGLK